MARKKKKKNIVKAIISTRKSKKRAKTATQLLKELKSSKVNVHAAGARLSRGNVMSARTKAARKKALTTLVEARNKRNAVKAKARKSLKPKAKKKK